jgi:hypothetical protein
MGTVDESAEPAAEHAAKAGHDNRRCNPPDRGGEPQKDCEVSAFAMPRSLVSLDPLGPCG